MNVTCFLWDWYLLVSVAIGHLYILRMVLLPGVMYCPWNGSDSIVILGFVYYVWDGFRSVVKLTYQRLEVGAGDCRVTSGGLWW